MRTLKSPDHVSKKKYKHSYKRVIVTSAIIILTLALSIWTYEIYKSQSRIKANLEARPDYIQLREAYIKGNQYTWIMDYHYSR